MRYIGFIACTLTLCVTCEGLALKVPPTETHEISLSKHVYVEYENKVQHYIRDSDALGGPQVTHTLSEDSAVPLGVYMANGVAALVVLSGYVTAIRIVRVRRFIRRQYTHDSAALHDP